MIVAMLRRIVPARAVALVWRALFALATGISRIGERHEIDWLVYNPLLFLWFHLAGMVVAPPIYVGLRRFFPEAQQLFDVGAGSGTMAAHGRRLGLEVHACEHSRVARSIARAQGVHCSELDLTRSTPATIPPGLDLAYCFEVGEHLPKDLSEPLVAFVASCAPVAVFSAAQPGQGGHGHINEQPPSYWINLFSVHGCEHDEAATIELRDHFRNDPVHVDWLINNVLVFRSRTHS